MDGTTVQALRKSWRNGGRWMIVAAGFALFSLVIILVTNLAIVFDVLDGHTNPLRYANPIQTSGSTVKPGDSVQILLTRCNQGKEAIRISGTVFWEPVAMETESVFASRVQRVLDPGCLTRSVLYTVPDELMSGQWRLVAQECSMDSSQRFCATWVSEIVRVSR